MRRLRRLMTTAVCVAAAGLLFVQGTSAAAAGVPVAAGALQAKIDAQLARHPGGVQISNHEIAYAGGNVIMTFPDPGRRTAPRSSRQVTGPGPIPLDLHGCPEGITVHWWCFYENKNFGGRRLQFKDCYTQHFSDYGFQNETSSWVNTNNGVLIEVIAGRSGLDLVLWHENGRSESSYVGDADNDRADYFTCHT